MSTQIKHRRGSDSDIAAFTPAIGEWVHNTSDNSIHTGDGATVGGNKLLTHKQITRKFPDLNDFINSTNNTKFDVIEIESYYEITYPSTAGPKGGHKRHRTGGTNTSPTVGSPVAVSTIGTGTQGGYVWDGDGVEWYLSSNQNINMSMFGIVADGVTDDTTNFIAMSARLENTGDVIKTNVGDTIHITAPVNINGYTLNLVQGSDLKVSGTDASVYGGGAVVVGVNGRLTGDGDIYTSGVLTPSSGSHTIRQEAGQVDGNLTVYSQLDEAFIHLSGDCKVKVYGGFARSFRSRLNVDAPTTLDIEYFNAGIRYTDKAILTPIVVPTDSRAVHLIPQIPIESKVTAIINGRYAWKNGAWLGYAGALNDNSVDLKNLVTDGYISKSGVYLDDTDSEQNGDGAGTCWEIEAAPDSILNGDSDSPRGYNLAIVGGSHRATSKGVHVGVYGDPNVVVVNSDDVEVGGKLKDGTVGVSVGEDGAQADNCVISARVINARNEPVRVSAARNTRISGAHIEGITDGTNNGSWAGLGEVSPVVRALREQYGANDIFLENTTISGPYTHDVIELGNGVVGGDGGLRVSRSNNTYACSLIPHDETEMQNLLGIHNPGSNRATPLTTVAASGGYADTGEITITEASGLTYAFTNLDAKYTDLDSYVKGSDTLADTLGLMYVVWYFRYDSAMVDDSTRLARFGLSSSGNASHVAQSFYAIFTAYETMLGRPLKDGEYLPFRVPLNDLIYSGADTSNLLYFVFSLDDVPVGYDATITAPMVVEVPKYT